MSFHDDRRTRRAFALLAAGMLTVGYLASETGVVLPNLATIYDLTADQLGLVVSIRFLGSVIAGLFMFLMGSRFRYVTYLAGSAVLNLLTGCLLLFADSYVAVLAVSLLRGGCLTATIANTNGALEAWFSGAKAERANRVHAYFGIGLVLAPLVALAAGRSALGWRAVWAGPAVGGFTVLALLRGAPTTDPRSTPDAESAGDAGMRAGTATRWDRDLVAAVGAAVAIAFVNVGVEAVILGWSPTILGGYADGGTMAAIGPAAVISLVLSVGVFAGRRSAARLVSRLTPPRYYVASAVFVAICGLLTTLIAGPAGGRPRFIAIVLALILGLATSALYPVLVSRVGSLGRRTAGRIFAVFELGAACGGTVFPALVGWVAGERPAAAYGAALATGAALLIVLSIALGRLLRRLGADRY